MSPASEKLLEQRQIERAERLSLHAAIVGAGLVSHPEALAPDTELARSEFVKTSVDLAQAIIDEVGRREAQ